MGQNATFIKLKIATKELVGELSSSISSSVDVIDVSSKKTARVRRILPGRVAENISFESLADDTSSDYGYSDAHGAMKNGTLVAWTIVRGEATLKSGNGYITALTLDNPDNDRSTMSGTIEVDNVTT
jgi:predicted secreted protein